VAVRQQGQAESPRSRRATAPAWRTRDSTSRRAAPAGPAFISDQAEELHHLEVERDPKADPAARVAARLELARLSEQRGHFAEAIEMYERNVWAGARTPATYAGLASDVRAGPAAPPASPRPHNPLERRPCLVSRTGARPLTPALKRPVHALRGAMAPLRLAVTPCLDKLPENASKPLALTPCSVSFSARLLPFSKGRPGDAPWWHPRSCYRSCSGWASSRPSS
jgi:hypothetical protein